MQPTHWIQAMEPVLEQGQPPGRGAWVAVVLVSVATLAGAWLARRDSKRMVGWLAVASATMLAIAVTDLLPDAWREAAETGVPLWVVGLAAAVGFSVITYFTRKGCGHQHGSESGHQVAGRHAPGRHRRLKEAVEAAVFGGMGTAAAMTTHRAIEGATLAFTASAVVVIALMVHSASEGLALAALLDMAHQRLYPWLVVACVSPAAGVLYATFSPLPGRVIPVLIGMITGVLLRTAIVGMRLAASKQASGRLSTQHVVVASAAAVTAAVLLAMAHAGEGTEQHTGQKPVGTRRTTPSVDPAGHGAFSPAPTQRPGPKAAQANGTSKAPPQPPPERPRPSPAGNEQARRERAQILAAVRSGRTSLAEVLQRDDDTARRLRVRQLLRALPQHDPAQVTTLLETRNIDTKRHVGALTQRQRRQLLTDFAGQPPSASPSLAPSQTATPGVVQSPR
jgi:hypothetical protein